MKHRTLLLALTPLVLLALLLSACAPAATEAPPATEPPATEPPQATEPPATEPSAGACEGDYVLVPKNLGNPYFDTANNGAQEAATELGITVLYQGSATADATEQISLLNSLIAQQPCGLAISANDADALVPTGQAAMEAGIPVVTWDSAIAPDGRDIHINQAVTAGIGAIQIQMASELAGEDGGQIAILSATSTAPNQNAWIEVMQEELTKPEYANLELVEVVYGDDDDTKSYNEAQALFTKYPDLEVIIAPTTVGIAASGRAVTDADLIGKVFVTGLGTPNQMREYVKNGASPQFALWNPGDLGYLAVYAMHALATGEITAEAGQTFTAGRLGEYTIEDDPDLGLNVLLGPPFVYNADNIDDFNW
ncbi:MAG TPA: rhamnose ABC transporter substrate-binding protein [Anaerolineales bacterium]|nr:rhamnose ABC transporter substrate-binding protein [Anaerolineales bacterium]